MLVIAALVTAAFYGWSLSPDPPDAGIRHVSHKYFAWQAEGWLSGRLDLPRTVPAGLLALPDPYDPDANRSFRMGGTEGVHDLSLYKGKLHLYWGPTPTLVAFLPWRILSGGNLPAAWASWAFAFAGWLAGAVLVTRAARRHFPTAPPVVVFAALIGIAVCSWSAVVLRRASVWEVPIFAACCFGALTWWLLAESSWAVRGSQWRWLAAASLAWGLAVGARPIWVVASAGLLVPIWLERAHWREKEFRRLVLAAAVPFGVCVFALLLHNAARFGHPLEFGQRWQLADARVENARLFAPEYVGFNLHAYLFSVPRLVAYFPFLLPAPATVPPPGHFGTEFVYGVFVTLPWLWLALLAPRRALVPAFMPAAISAVCVLAVLALFAGVTARYQLEIALPLAILAGLGVLALDSERRRLRWLWRTVWVGAVLLSLGTTWAASCHFMGMYAYSFPAAYEAVARRANALAVRLGWSPRGATEAVELTVLFPKDTPPGRQEALVASGTVPAVSVVLVEYLDAGHLRFIFHVSGHNTATAPMRFDRSVPRRLRVELGGMLPPATHPFWKETPSEEIKRRRMQLRFAIDDQNISLQVGPQAEPADAKPAIGAMPGEATDRFVFTGRIVEQRLIRRPHP